MNSRSKSDSVTAGGGGKQRQDYKSCDVHTAYAVVKLSCLCCILLKVHEKFMKNVWFMKSLCNT